jgi:hypothetical protein
VRNYFAARYQYLCTALAIFLLCSVSVGADEKVPEFITFTFENDLFVGDDDGYTNGLGITYGKGPFKAFSNDNLPNWLLGLTKDLYVSTMKNKDRALSRSIFPNHKIM